MEKGDIADDCF